MVLIESSTQAMDAVLASLRIDSAVLSLATLEAPFTVSSGETGTGVFHAVLEGEVWALLGDGSDSLHLAAGWMAVFPSGSAHRMAHSPSATAPAVPVATGGAGALPTMEIRNGGPVTTLLCGTVRFHESPVMSPAAALPPLVVAGEDGEGSGRWIRQTVEMITAELSSGAPGSTALALRLTDVLAIRAVRATMSSEPAAPGWLAVLQDDALAPALGALHADPSRDWTSKRLAEQAGMSRSAFYQRFTAAMGEPPAAYVARWRMHVACGLLASTSLPIGEVGRRVGFVSAPTFSNAFRRVVGTTPSTHRRWALASRTP